MVLVTTTISPSTRRSFLAVAGRLCDGCVQRRFAADPVAARAFPSSPRSASSSRRGPATTLPGPHPDLGKQAADRVR